MAVGKSIGLFGLIGRIYDMLGTAVTSATNGLEALENVSLVAKEKSESYLEEQRIENQIKLEELKAKRLKVTQRQIEATQQQAIEVQ